MVRVHIAAVSPQTREVLARHMVEHMVDSMVRQAMAVGPTPMPLDTMGPPRTAPATPIQVAQCPMARHPGDPAMVAAVGMASRPLAALWQSRLRPVLLHQER